MIKTICIGLLILVHYGSFAQSDKGDKKSRRILSDVTRRYQKLNVFEARFNFTLVNSADHLNETQAGTLITQPSMNRYRVKLPGQEVFSDGKSSYTWLKTQKEIQISNLDTTSQSINPARLFSLYQNGYRYSYNKEISEGKTKLLIIDLTPLKIKKIYKAQIAITRRAHQIYRIRLFDKNGSQISYTVTQFIANPVLKGDEFTFDKKSFQGVEVIDLR